MMETATTSAARSSFQLLEKRLNGAQPWLTQLRRKGMEQFSSGGFPTPRLEDWKYTNVAAIAQLPFGQNAPEAAASLSADQLGRLRALIAPSPAAAILVFLNGRFVSDVASLGNLPSGLIIQNLAAALKEKPSRVEALLGRNADIVKHPFAALNTAFIEDGAFIDVPAGHCILQPIYVIQVRTGASAPMVHPRTVLSVGESSHVSLVEAFVGLEPGEATKGLTNAVTEISLAANATVEHYQLQAEPSNAFHVSLTQVHQGAMSHYTSHNFSVGGALARHDLHSVLDGEGGDCTLNGLYLVDGKQHVDNHTLVDHAKPNCRSEELYKGVLTGEGRAVFNGRVIVRPDAQKTDANQSNRNLLLSDDARVDTKPQLEIFADDVKCAHGAAIGSLDDEALFYLQARGIDRQAAGQLLTYAFVGELLSRVRVKSLRSLAETLVLRKLPGGEQFAGVAG